MSQRGSFWSTSSKDANFFCQVLPRNAGIWNVGDSERAWLFDVRSHHSVSSIQIQLNDVVDGTFPFDTAGNTGLGVALVLELTFNGAMSTVELLVMLVVDGDRCDRNLLHRSTSQFLAPSPFQGHERLQTVGTHFVSTV